MVRQECYGLLLAHFAIRGLIHEATLKVNADPDRLSFLHAVRVVRRELPLSVFPPRARPAWYEAVLAELAEDRVVSNRGRRTPRGVKRKSVRSGFERVDRGRQQHPPVSGH